MLEPRIMSVWVIFTSRKSQDFISPVWWVLVCTILNLGKIRQKASMGESYYLFLRHAEGRKNNSHTERRRRGYRGSSGLPLPSSAAPRLRVNHSSFGMGVDNQLKQGGQEGIFHAEPRRADWEQLVRTEPEGGLSL